LWRIVRRAGVVRHGARVHPCYRTGPTL
jgi:hypothetical protein